MALIIISKYYSNSGIIIGTKNDLKTLTSASKFTKNVICTKKFSFKSHGKYASEYFISLNLTYFFCNFRISSDIVCNFFLIHFHTWAFGPKATPNLDQWPL